MSRIANSAAAAAAESLQSCLTLYDPIDSSPLGSPVPGILHARTLEWLPFPSPMHESEKWKWSRSVVSNSSRPHGLQPTRLFRPWDFPGKSTGVGCKQVHWITICGSAGKESTCDAGDLGSIPGLGRSPGEGNGIYQKIHLKFVNFTAWKLHLNPIFKIDSKLFNLKQNQWRKELKRPETVML